MKKIFTFIAVAVMALASQANVLTICDGAETNSNVPISGFNYDLRNTMSQMIYPAEKLAELQNGQITEVKFYATAGFNLGQNTIQLSLKMVDQSDFSAVAPVTETLAVATGSTIPGETELVFTLDEPYEYTGGNLLIETLLLTAGSFRTTNWYGMNTGYASGYYQYQFNWGTPNPHTENFLPKVTFTFEPAATPGPTEQTAPPSISADTQMGVHAYFVTITESEPSDLYYRYSKDGGEWSDWTLYDGEIAFDEDGYYQVEAYAITPGKTESLHVGCSFVVTPRTGLDEFSADKKVAGVRYFNLAGQEMAQPNGLTIVVTTYTDGTSSATKVIK